jgi:hypothetical protein
MTEEDKALRDKVVRLARELALRNPVKHGYEKPWKELSGIEWYKRLRDEDWERWERVDYRMKREIL